MLPEAPAAASEASYDTQASAALVSFTLELDWETLLVGYPKARLWVEAKDADDMDLFVLVQKLSTLGAPFAVQRPRPRREDAGLDREGRVDPPLQRR